MRSRAPLVTPPRVYKRGGAGGRQRRPLSVFLVVVGGHVASYLEAWPPRRFPRYVLAVAADHHPRGELDSAGISATSSGRRVAAEPPVCTYSLPAALLVRRLHL